MFSVNKKHVDWSEEYENWDTSCSVCGNSGMVTDREETWRTGEVYERLEACQKVGINPFLARHDEMPTDIEEIPLCRMDEYFAVLQETECEKCNGSGYEDLMWNTVWEIGRQVTDDQKRKVAEAGCIVVEDADGEAWLTLGGCGQDNTPHLCHAWLELGFTWLPLEWIADQAGSDYIESCKNAETSQRIRVAMDYTLSIAKARIDDLILRNSKHVMIGVKKG